MATQQYNNRAEKASPIEAELPSNIAAEQQVLGTILYYAQCYYDVASFLTAQDFYRDEHRVIYEAMGVLAEHEKAMNPLTVFGEITRMDKASEVRDGVNYLFYLMNLQIPPTAVEDHARLITETAQLRQGIAGAALIAGAGYHGQIEEMQAHIEALVQTSHTNAGRNDIVRIGDMVTPFFEELETLSTMEGTPGVSTGFRDLDRIFGGGLQQSDLIVLAARPGMGKSSMALNIAYNATTNRNKPVGTIVFTLEMGKKQWLQRLIATQTGIDFQRVRTGKLEDDEWEKVIESMGILGDAPLYLDDTGGITIMEMRRKIRALMAKQDIGLIIVDYLQMVQASGNVHNRNEEVGEVSRGLKILACELNIPILALASLSRAVEGRASKVPQMSDLRESGSIESDADIVMFIYRDDQYNPETQRPNTADILIAKQRNGPVGEVSLYCKLNQMKFANLESHPMVGNGEGDESHE